MTMLLGLFFMFGAGEEISWGQRLFEIESSGFFDENNAQGEMNLHNLFVNDTKINKLEFSGSFVFLLNVVFPYNRSLFQASGKQAS